MRMKIYSFIFLLNSYISGLIVPVLSLLLMEKGATLSSISAIIGIFSFTVIVLELPTGIMADVIGRKKTFLLSLVLSLVFSIVFLLGHGLLMLCIGVFIYGLNRAVSSGSFEALFIDSYINEFGKERLHEVTTRIHVLDALGLSAGALTGGYLPEISEKYFILSGKYDLNLIVRLILTVLVIALAVVFIKEAGITEVKQRITLKQHIKNSSNVLFKSKNIICIFISVFTTGFFFSSLETYWQPHLISLMPDDSTMFYLGVMAFLYLAAAMAGNIISSNMLSKYNAKKTYLALRIFLVITLILTALQTNMITFIMFYSLIYLVLGMANIPESVILNSEIPNSSRASILSVNSLILQIGMLLGSFVNSFIINYLSIPKLWVVAAVIIFISVVVIYRKLLSEQTKESVIQLN